MTTVHPKHFILPLREVRGDLKNYLTCHDVVMKHMAWEFSPINIQKRNQLTLFNMLNIITLQHNAEKKILTNTPFAEQSMNGTHIHCAKSLTVENFKSYLTKNVVNTTLFT